MKTTATHTTTLLRRVRTRKAFTLIELLVVIVILGILMAVALPTFLSQQNKAKDSAAAQYLTTAYKSAKAESISNNNAYPAASSLSRLIGADQPQLSFVVGTSEIIASASPKEIAISPASTASTLIMYSHSGSGKIITLDVAVNGAPQTTGAVATGGGSPTSFPVVETADSTNNGSASYAYWLNNSTLVHMCGATLCETTPSGDTTLTGVAPLNDSFFSVSPDRSKIAFFDGSLKLVNADGSNIQTINSSWISNCCLVWSADDSTVYFQDSTGALLGQPVGGGSATTLEPANTNLTVNSQGGGYLVGNDLNNATSGTLYTMTTAGASKFESYSVTGGSPALSPDGSKIAYRNQSDFAVHVMNRDGSGDIKLSPSGVNAAGATWSADGTKIAFDSPGGGGVWYCNADGSGLTEVTTKAAAGVQFSPDGTHLSYSVYDSATDKTTVYTVGIS